MLEYSTLKVINCG